MYVFGWKLDADAPWSTLSHLLAIGSTLLVRMSHGVAECPALIGVAMAEPLHKQPFSRTNQPGSGTARGAATEKSVRPCSHCMPKTWDQNVHDGAGAKGLL
jgi:hypothetical protein